ncbi:MAG: LytR C-terminal domain-containing protein [Patescibacteria group bacterium]
MRKKRNLNKGNNTKVAMVFVAFVLLIVSISLIFKFIFVLSQSQFDDSKRFTLTVSNKRELEVISFSPISRSVSILKLGKNLDTPVNKFLAIPIDGFVKGESLDLNQKIETLLSQMILNYRKLQTNLTVIDCIKLFIFAKSLPERGVNIRNISQDLSVSEIDSIVTRLVSDELIERDGKTIQVVNGTNVVGLGNRLARFITNMGGDVIFVATANNHQKYSMISYIDNKSYTVERLNKILGFKTVKVSDKLLADISIVIGEDSLNSLSF